MTSSFTTLKDLLNDFKGKFQAKYKAANQTDMEIMDKGGTYSYVEEYLQGLEKAGFNATSFAAGDPAMQNAPGGTGATMAEQCRDAVKNKLNDLFKALDGVLNAKARLEAAENKVRDLVG